MTINDFIKELQSIPEERRKLPLVIDCPNGMETYPSIKMRFQQQDLLPSEENKVEKMVVTWKR